MIVLKNIEKRFRCLRLGTDENGKIFVEFFSYPENGSEDKSAMTCCQCGKKITEGWMCENQFYCEDHVACEE